MKLTTAATLLALLALGGSAIAQEGSTATTEEAVPATPPKANLKVRCETDSYDCPETFFSVLRDPSNGCEFYPCDFDTSAAADADAGGTMEAGEEAMDESVAEVTAEATSEAEPATTGMPGMTTGAEAEADATGVETTGTETGISMVEIITGEDSDAEALAVEEGSGLGLPAELPSESEPVTTETTAITAQPEAEAGAETTEAETTEEDAAEPVAEPPAEETTNAPAVPTPAEAAATEEATPIIPSSTPPFVANCRACTNTPTKNMIKRSYDCTTAIQALAVQCRDDAGWRAGAICEFSCYKAGRGYAHTDVTLEGGTRCCEEGEEPLTPEVVTAEEVQIGIAPGEGLGAPALGGVGDDAAEVAREQDDEQPAATATESEAEAEIAEAAESMTMLEEATMAEEAEIGDAPENMMTEAGDAETETTEATSDEPTIEVNNEMVVDAEPASEGTETTEAATDEPAATTTETSEATTEVTVVDEPATVEEDTTTTTEETTTLAETSEAATSTEAAENNEATTTPADMTAGENYDGTTEPMCGPAAAGAVGDVGVLCPFAADGGVIHCCSSYGFCGTTDAYCGAGCQAGFGLCDDVPAATEEITEIADEATAEPTIEITEGEMDDAAATTTTTTAPEVGDLMPDLTEIAREDDAATTETSMEDEESNGLRGSTASAIQYADSSATGVQVTTGVVAVLGAASAVLLGML